MGFPAQEPRSLLSRSQEQPEGSRAWTQEGRLPREWEGRVGPWGQEWAHLYLFLLERLLFSHALLHLGGHVLDCAGRAARGWCLLMEVILMLPLMQGLHVLENPDPRKPQVPPSWCGPPSFLTWTLLPSHLPNVSIFVPSNRISLQKLE